VLVWFLLKHVASRDFNRPRRDFSPLRASIASMAMIPWERLVAQCEEYGVQDLYFVDVEQWREALGGMEAVVMIPLICVLRYKYEVLINRVRPLWGACECYT